MYDEIPSLLYVAGALITVLSWTLFAFSKTIRPEEGTAPSSRLGNNPTP